MGTHAPRLQGLSARALPTGSATSLNPEHSLHQARSPREEAPTLPGKVSSIGLRAAMARSCTPSLQPISGPWLRAGAVPTVPVASQGLGTPEVTVTLAKDTDPLHPTSLWWGLTHRANLGGFKRRACLGEHASLFRKTMKVWPSSCLSSTTQE